MSTAGTGFKDRIRAALANESLQSALDANAERRINVRRQALASLSDPEGMRQLAHSIRADVIQNLDSYLDQFTAKAKANGMIVHQAADGPEAVRIVLEIARQNGAKLIAKSKTMVGEEIELNHALEHAGLRVVETDLGEYIVQLRGERPAHIITPAVHLRRKEVGQTFHEKLGVPLTEDIGEMTEVARKILRQVFLEADIGISGVNFGVAQTGTICLVTNEGNGRMVTTVPPVHIALMGIERLAPTMSDLAVFLALLPRSATGQKLTVYTSLIQGPRRPGDPDGPRERHLILLDNGRRAMRLSPMAEALYCIRCGACLNACPVFREIGGHAYVGKDGEPTSYPGPIGSVVSPALFGAPIFGNLARASSLCGACKEACPVDIDLPKLLLRVRAGAVTAEPAPPQHVPWYLNAGLRVFAWAAARPGLFGAAQRMAGLAGKVFSSRSGWLRLPAVTGWGYSKDFPRPASRPFHEQFQGTPAPAGAGGSDWAASGHHKPSASESVGLPAQEFANPQDIFVRELTALGGKVSAGSLPEQTSRLIGLLKQEGIDRIMAWESDHLPAGLEAALQEAGITVAHQPDPALRAGLTGALAAAAETGSIALAAGPGRLASASLLPEIHAVFLNSADIYPTLASLLAPQAENSSLAELVNASAAALISGPSRTADIEMTLTIGVHGPKELYAFIWSLPLIRVPQPCSGAE